ncbi:MAG: hypothetical protein QM703_14915 [Gemmatales bacterium]
MCLPICILLLTLGALITWTGRTWCEDEKVFKPKNGVFTITLPAGETTGDRSKVMMIGKHRVPVEASGSKSKDGTQFLSASIGIPAVVMRDIPAEKRFDILRDAILKPMNGTVTGEKDIEHDTITGKEYQINLASGAARMQLYTISGFVVYAIVDGKDKDSVNTKQANAFYNSLKMSDKAKDVFRRVKR